MRSSSGFIAPALAAGGRPPQPLEAIDHRQALHGAGRLERCPAADPRQPAGRSVAPAQRYYAHPQNQFWRLLGSAIGEDLAALTYEERLERLAARGIALWDVVGEARRQGSLDGAIRGATPNRSPTIVATHPRLRAIAFNGQTAAGWGGRRWPDSARNRADRPAVVQPGLHAWRSPTSWRSGRCSGRLHAVRKLPHWAMSANDRRDHRGRRRPAS